jgi:hypothetical protein
MKQVNVFSGQVNDRHFGDRSEMSKYIESLMEKDEPISTLSYSTETKWIDDEPEQLQECPVQPWNEYIKYLDTKIPEQYGNVMKYLIPYIKEDFFANFDPKREKDNFEDMKRKLAGRMEWMERFLFSEYRKRSETDDPAMMRYFKNLATSFLNKSDWVYDRVGFMEYLLAEVETENIQWSVNKPALESAIMVYSEVNAFCKACHDIISDTTGCYEE